ncbi:MAG TPA: GGDEF domain-containing protein, partial [Rugosibacter sp.]|nr:GGDEF domain-containing protein [Rugosibacter sp.]
MADAIGDKNFITMKEPRTLEFKSLARGMNRLSQRIKGMWMTQSQLLDQMRIEANYDAVTGLMNRKYFSSRVNACIANDENFTKGVLVISHISNLAEINEKLGETESNAVLKRMGTSLDIFCKKHPNLFAGRLTGSDFAVFSTEPTDSNLLCGQIRNTLLQAAGLENKFENFKLPTISSSIHKSERLNALNELIKTIKGKTDPAEMDLLELIDKNDFTKYEDSNESEWRTMLTS